jgi:tetratricopeptide (TPR) repeat protein
VESFQLNQGNSSKRLNSQTFSNTQNHNLTEKQQNLLKWMVQEVRAGNLNEEEIWFLWTNDGTSLSDYRGSVPETKPATLDALRNEGCLVYERRTNNEYRFALTRRAYDIADSILNTDAQDSASSKKAIGATGSNSTLPVAPSLSDPLTSTTSPSFSTYNPATFTGRDTETATLTERLQGGCRIVAISGITGIGKTALAERVVANLNDTSLPYYRFSLDDLSLTPDFASSGAALLRELGEEPTLGDQKDPNHLLNHILSHLCQTPCRVQIDSLERLLRGNEQEGWSEFCDPLWLDLLQKFLSSNHCPSQLLLTSQEIPGDLDAAASRHPKFWYCEPLQGLKPNEQQTLFQNLGFSFINEDWERLQRIGAFYEGHPLVLQVIAEEMRQPPFRGNIALYWQHYEAEFTETANTNAHRLERSRLFRRRVRQRVEQSLETLPEAARQMLCACSVFRRPVPEEFWYAMLSVGDAQTAFDTLQERHLIEYTLPTPPPYHSPTPSPPFLIRQHNLIRSVASSLLKVNPVAWEAAERRAAHLWLTAYEPAPNAPNLETVRGYLEAFDHYCGVGDWEQARELYTHQLASTSQALHWQLLIWANYKELIEVSRKLVDRISSQTKRLCLNQIGNSYRYLGQVEKAIEYYQQALEFTRDTGDRQGEGAALGNLGIAYDNLGQYERAIDFHQQRLTIAREIGNLRGEGNALGNLGNAYRYLGQYEQAIRCHQQHLMIAREIGDRQGEGNALGNLGTVYHSLRQYEQAITCHQQYLTIAREIGDRRGEGAALVNLGATKLKMRNHSESLNNNQAALQIFQDIGVRDGEAEALKNLAEVHQALGNVEEVCQYAQQALLLATELGIPLKAECEALLAELEQDSED